MGGASERIYLQFEDLLVKYAHVTKEPNLIKISLDQAARTKSTEITIHERMGAKHGCQVRSSAVMAYYYGTADLEVL